MSAGEGAWRTKEKLELYIPMCVVLRGHTDKNNKYFILFIDDFTRMQWVYFLKERYELPTILKKFKAMAENQSACRMKRI